MQVSQTDAAAGENERNENVAVAPVDLNILKDLLVRIGTDGHRHSPNSYRT